MTKLGSLFRICCVVASIALSATALGSCSLAKNQMEFDRSAEKDLQDYRDVLAPRAMPQDETAPVPEFQSVISTPADLKLPSPLVTVSVNQTVSLRDLLFELADQANVDLEMDPQIRGSLIFTAKEKPFNEVVGRICEMAGLRYKFENNVLRIELDRPYLKNYKFDYMNMARKSSSNIKTSTTVSSDTDSATSDSGSGASIDNTYDGDLWKELDEGLQQLLTASDLNTTLATLADPVSTPVAPPPPAVDANGQPIQAPPQASTVPPSLNVTPASTSDPLVPNPPSTYSISKQTGVISVFTTERQHKQVQKFLDDLRVIYMTQILIEAKVLEVKLTDEFATGIDWNNLNITGLLSASIQGDAAGFPKPDFLTASGNVFTLTGNFGNDFRPVVTALSRFGTVRALSSPRVTVMNSQPAVVNVTTNSVYFEIETTTTPCSPTPCAPTITQTSTIRSAPEGVLMNVLPTADSKTGEVVLAVRPTISKINRNVDDPVNVGNTIPEMAVQEIDSIVKMQSGQTLIMGGLMRDLNDVTREGVPLLADLPIIGAPFRSHGDRVQKSELVIFLKATIVPGSNVDAQDRELYKKFSRDRHPTRL